jgi:hypothetical protein
MLLDHQIIPQAVERVLMAAEQIKMEALDLGCLSRDFGQSGQALARSPEPVRWFGAPGTLGPTQQSSLV